MNTKSLSDRCFTATWVAFLAFFAVGLGLRVLLDPVSGLTDKIIDYVAGGFLILTVSSAIVGVVCFISRGR